MAYSPAIHEAQGVVNIVLAGTVNAGDLLGYSSGWKRADADARIPARLVAMQTGASGDTIPACVSGVLVDLDAPYTAGDPQYLSATAGEHTATIPAVSSTLTLLQRIGVAVTTEKVVFDLTPRGPHYLRATAAVNPASAATDAIADLAVTVTGVLATDYVQALPPADIESGLVVHAGDTVATPVD